jgi:glutamate formiminotransferase / 5-formyltetrahydrofolate cyclo-ligase
VFECVINLSEGRDAPLLAELGVTAGESLRDLHADVFHNRSVFTLINDPGQLTRDVRALVSAAFTSLDLTRHEGVHPRFGVVDVVPFVALDHDDKDQAVALRDETAVWIAGTFNVPVFLYGPVNGVVRTLPEVRKSAFRSLKPDKGPDATSATLGASAVGARELLVAWNLWLSGITLPEARVIARWVRRVEVRALAFQVGDQVQVSCNLVAPLVVGPSAVFDHVTKLLRGRGTVERCELVGLAPRALLDREDRARWSQLDLSESRTIESRIG